MSLYLKSDWEISTMDIFHVGRATGRSLLQTASVSLSAASESARIGGMGIGVLIIAAFVVLALAMWFIGERLERGG
jgi:hypothetical protein